MSGLNAAADYKGKSKEKLQYPSTKARGSPTKKGSSSKVPAPASDEDDGGDLPSLTSGTPEGIFYCCYAINSQRGLYYNFKWDQHFKAALKNAFEVPQDEAPRATWGSGEEWNVDPTEIVTKPKKKVGPPPKKRVKVEDRDQELSEEDVDSGSEAEIDSESEEDEDLSDVDESDEDDAVEDDDEFDAVEPRTPSKKRKRGQTETKTPKRRTASLAQPTPHSKLALRKRRKLKAAANGSSRKRKAGKLDLPQPNLSFKTDMSHLPPDPWLRAMHVLHVGNRPEALPCRDGEYNEVFDRVEELLEEGSGGCVCRLDSVSAKKHDLNQTIDISGVPGTGKTATVHTVVNELKRRAEANVRTHSTCRLPLLTNVTRKSAPLHMSKSTGYAYPNPRLPTQFSGRPYVDKRASRSTIVLALIKV